MAWERLGVEPASGKAVWVCWLAAPLGRSAAALMPLACPECGKPVALDRDRGVLTCVAETAGATSVSDRCSACAARLHFDTTAPADQALLRWTKVAVGLLDLSPPSSITFEQAADIRAAVMRGQRARWRE